MLLKKISKFIAFVLFIELIFRLGLSILFGNIIIKSSDLYYKYYPELKKLDYYQYDDNRTNILVLGGSVICNDTIWISQKDSEPLPTTFCNFNQLLDQSQFNVLSLAAPSHNSLDSKTKYDFLKSRKFDYVFVYHGLNDNRANNVSFEKFNSNYRHIEFYDDLFLINKFQNKPLLALIFLPKWFIHQITKKKDDYIPKEFYYGLLSGQPEDHVKEGKDIKTATSFLNNYQDIKAIAAKRNQQLIVSTYAWYIPKNYTLDKFRAKELDYDQQLYPIELYGIPENIEKGLIQNNSILISFAADNEDILFFDFNKEIEKSNKNFEDICHLNTNGCKTLANQLLQIIVTD